MNVRRCICGRSSRLPVCDGAHREEGWACDPRGAPRAAVCFVAAPCNHNVAERLAHVSGGVAAHRVEGTIEAERLVLLAEGHELDQVAEALARVRARRREVWALAPAARGLAPEGYACVDVADHEGPLWVALERAAAGGTAAAAPFARDALFLSHAVADEPELSPVLADVRRWGVDVFSCGDSIAPGSDWEAAILGELRARPCFVLALSAASRGSSWCAFEAGAARALAKRTVVIHLDGTPLPSFVQRHHAIDLAREQRARPWLSRRDALAGALLAAAAPPAGTILP